MRPISPLNQVWIVARREMDERVHARSFIVTTLIFVILIIGGILLGGGLLGGSDSGSTSKTTVAVPASLPEAAALAAAFDVTQVATADDAVAAVQDGTVDAAVVTSTTGEVVVVALTKAPSDLVGALTVTPAVQLLDTAGAVNQAMAAIIPIVFGVVFMMITMISINPIAVNTVVEKQTRIVEILLGSVRAPVLLAGKVIGNTLVAFLQTLVLAAAAIGSLVASGHADWPGQLTGPILWYIPFFLVGFILMATMSAGLASLVSRQEDVTTAISPLTILVMLPYMVPLFLTTAQNWHGMMIASYFPIVSTVVVPTRMALGQGTWVEALISLAILLVTTVLAVLAAARVYRYSLLLTGKKISFRTALRAKSELS
ncbi:MAG: ABC transporter permease [Propionibacteriaceae bacterium]|jgi:ABC-2 type transport system permease protein|nr:ABC transporter permease [Propionibacteriaceae bacterium]